MTTVLTGDPLGWRLDHPTSIAIGVFDGVHRGHQAVMAGLVEESTVRGLTPVALTFDPHPLHFLAPERAPQLLTSIPVRIGLLGALGVEVVGVLPFAQIRDLTPESFAHEILSQRLQASLVTVGSDFRFGLERRGDVAFLGEIGPGEGFEVDVVSPVTAADGEIVSSSAIRELLETGDVARAGQLLGRAYALAGEVVRGDGRGRTIGFPTANLGLDPRLLVPRNGVYAARASWEGEGNPAVVNVGVRPTFGDNRHTVEGHLIDFEGDLYGKELNLEFVSRVRDERRFDSVEELSDQIGRDRETARSLLLRGN